MRVGVDTGGTFTDVVAVDDAGVVRAHKLPSKPAAPWEPVLDGARHVAGDAIDELSHSTTVATNALLERRGGPVALVTTAGFEDVLEIGRQARPQLYALHPVVPPPLVDAPLRFGVDERLAADGSVLRAPSPEALAELAARVGGGGARRRRARDRGLPAARYANAAHERAGGRGAGAAGAAAVAVVGGAAAAARVRAHLDDGGRRLRAAGDRRPIWRELEAVGRVRVLGVERRRHVGGGRRGAAGAHAACRARRPASSARWRSRAPAVSTMR